MSWQVTLLFLSSSACVIANPTIVYVNVQFEPPAAYWLYRILSPIGSRKECMCHCLVDPVCLTGGYIGINQTCLLFSVPLTRNWLQVAVVTMNAAVFSFTNKSATASTMAEQSTYTATPVTTAMSTSVCSNTEIFPVGRAPSIMWYFENNLNDYFGVYNGIGQNNPTYGVGRNGCGKCLNLMNALQQAVFVNVTPYVDLRSISFSIEAWIRPTINVTDGLEHVILGQCSQLAYRKCMRAAIGTPGVMSFLFRSDTLTDSQLVPIDVWSHVAYVYDLTALTMSLYLNGTLRTSTGSHGPYQGAPTFFEIGNVVQYGYLYFAGCIDEISFYPFARTAAEVTATFALG